MTNYNELQQDAFVWWAHLTPQQRIEYAKIYYEGMHFISVDKSITKVVEIYKKENSIL